MSDLLRFADNGIPPEDIITWHMPSVFDIDLEKSDADGTQTRPIHGWCSTEARDRQDEVVVAKGLDFSEFQTHGYYNDNHKQDTAAVLGEPTLTELRNGAWWTEGFLYRNHGPSDRIWELAVAMKKSGAKRRLGFSIEGKVLERDNRNRILRALVRMVAITNCPVNTTCTWDIVSKSFAPASAIEDASCKALSAAHGLRTSGGAALLTESLEGATHEDLTLREAVAYLQKRRPQLSKAMCVRIIQYARTR